MSDKPNIAVVVLDTLRKDAFDEHFEWLPGKRFENTWSPSHWTTPVHASLFTGRYPTETGVYAGHQQFNVDTQVLPEQLQDSGYRTRAISCNINISEYFGFDRGFDEFTHLGYHTDKLQHIEDPDLYDWSTIIDADGPAVARYLTGLYGCITSDCDIIRSIYGGLDLKFGLSKRFGDNTGVDDMGAKRVLQRVKNTKFGDAEFLLLNLMEVHEPYEIPVEYRDSEEISINISPSGLLLDDANLNTVCTRYDNAASYLSDMYRELFGKLEAAFDYVITLSDHGQLLGEHGYYSHTYGISPELTHVPLVISGSDVNDAKIKTTTSLLDVYRTVCELAGIKANSQSRGHDLRDMPRWTNGVLTEYHGIPHPERTLEPLRSWAASTPDADADAYQETRRGLAINDGYYRWEDLNGHHETGTPPSDVDLEVLLADLVTGLDKAEIGESSIGLSPEAEEHLEHLGYV